MDDLSSLRERAKELRCLYDVDAILDQHTLTTAAVFAAMAERLPFGWQWPDRTGARIAYLGRPFQSAGFSDADTVQSCPIELGGMVVGHLDMSVHAPPDAPAFLPEEHTLQARVAARLSDFLERRHAELLGLTLTPEALHWSWRQAYAEAVARHLDMERFGIEAIYLGGSTEAGTAASSSDIDLYLRRARGTDVSNELMAWLDGWSLCLAEMACRQTGIPMQGGLLNVGWLSEEPAAHRTDLRCLRRRQD